MEAGVTKIVIKKDGEVDRVVEVMSVNRKGNRAVDLDIEATRRRRNPPKTPNPTKKIKVIDST